MTKSLVQEQFGATAAHYLTSKPHAKGKSLERLVELVQPQPAWRALDVATGAGHTAYAFAPHVARVWATDITEEMLALLKAMLAETTPEVKAFLRPEGSEGNLTFHLSEGLFIAHRK